MSLVGGFRRNLVIPLVLKGSDSAVLLLDQLLMEVETNAMFWHGGIPWHIGSDLLTLEWNGGFAEKTWQIAGWFRGKDSKVGD